MLWSESQFTQAASLAWNDILQTKPSNYQGKLKALYKKEHGLGSFFKKYEASMWDEELQLNCSYGYQLYKKASENSLHALVLGPDVIRQRIMILSNFGISAVTPFPGTVENQKKTVQHEGVPIWNLEHASVTEGGVLSEANWWPFFNDAWVLGGVHSNALFYLYIPGGNLKLRNEVLWDSAEGRLRVLGRELVALAAFGYKRVKIGTATGINSQLASQLSYVFAPDDRVLTQSACFTELFKAIATVSSAKEIQDLLADRLAIEYDSYDYGVMGSTEFVATENVPAYWGSSIESFHDRIEIFSGSKLSIAPGTIGDYLKVRVYEASARLIRTGFPNQFLSNWSDYVYIHRGIFEQYSGVAKPL